MRQHPTINPYQIRFWKGILYINIALGLFMLVLSLTNLSFPGTWPNYVFPPIIGLTTLILLLGFLLPSAPKKLRRFATFSSFPAIGCGCLKPFLLLCMIIPPFTLAFLFAIDEMTNEQRIQSVPSPDRTRVAEVYFRGVGAYSGGNGRITVRVRPRFLPFIEWEVFNNSRSNASEESENYLTWIDNRELLISENQEKVLANQFYFSPDPVFFAPVILFQAVSQISVSTLKNIESTTSVRHAPTYPVRYDDGYEFDTTVNSQFRHYNADVNPSIVLKWYKDELSKGPWQLKWIESHQDQGYDMIIEGYCLYATKQKSDGQIDDFYFEIFGTRNNPTKTHINISTPNPITDHCSRYAR